MNTPIYCNFCRNPSIKLTHSDSLNICYCVNCFLLAKQYERMRLMVPLDGLKDFDKKFMEEIILYICESCEKKTEKLYKFTYFNIANNTLLYYQLCKSCCDKCLNLSRDLERIRLKIRINETAELRNEERLIMNKIETILYEI